MTAPITSRINLTANRLASITNLAVVYLRNEYANGYGIKASSDKALHEAASRSFEGGLYRLSDAQEARLKAAFKSQWNSSFNLEIVKTLTESHERNKARNGT